MKIFNVIRSKIEDWYWRYRYFIITIGIFLFISGFFLCLWFLIILTR